MRARSIILSAILGGALAFSLAPARATLPGLEEGVDGSNGKPIIYTCFDNVPKDGKEPCPKDFRFVVRSGDFEWGRK